MTIQLDKISHKNVAIYTKIFFSIRLHFLYRQLKYSVKKKDFLLKFTEKMSFRDHPFNRSTRPLLERRAQPQIISPKPEFKVHGFNDFKYVAKQYKELNSSFIGYPYGNPPSPTVTTDFIFSDDSGIISDTTLNSNKLNDTASSEYRYNEDSYTKQYRWVPEKALQPLSNSIKKCPEETAGPFIFGIDTNENEEFSRNTESVIETNAQYSNLVTKVNLPFTIAILKTNRKIFQITNTGTTSCSKKISTDKKLLKNNRKRNKSGW